MILNEPRDILGEIPFLHKLYTQISFCYPVPSSTIYSNIISTLTAGLERLSTSFPWLAGQVVQLDNGDYRITPLEQTPRLTIKDLREDLSVPTWATLKEADFPMKMLDESVICPRSTLSDSTAKDAPVMLVQVNWLQGGMILSILAQHDTMDMTGQAHVISLLSKACRGDAFTEEEVTIGNPDRQAIIPLLDSSYTPGPELANQLILPNSAGTLTSDEPTDPISCTWSNFSFSPSSLSTLKSTATTSLSKNTPYITTDDALTAFIWQSILRARSSRLRSDSTIRFARAVDARRYLNVPDTYPGLLQNMTYHSYPLSDLLSMPLGEISAALRSAVDPKVSDIAFRTRALATYLSQPSSESKASVSMTARLNLSSDVTLSSWAKFECYGYDFEFGLGKPEAVRRPKFYPVEGLLYLLPKRGDGEIVASFCLRDEDLEKLKGDGEWCQFARYIG
ncbi:hypothetical protein P154DRAFT_615076 [Amniculicola lignicola CBS 123094]|uniref:Trichothecene 3-O-acetyltransferase-like N-terminal domain-containing protein n=1 Tax=Amniculicola lignicola CBS 123094 TaxID=1392246 RepID=A0A6A5WZL4_9PLEO|nr:hypothetical protein P154DRAFT_615076 [Amniculicola lignicola CBS 123094]